MIAFVCAAAVALLALAATALAAPPPNDNFANAQPLHRLNTQLDLDDLTAGTNVQATFQGGEPQHGDAFGTPTEGGQSIWYSFTPTYNEEALFAVCTGLTGPDFNPLVGVYTGLTVSSLTSQGTNAPNDCGSGGDNDIVSTFQAVSGTTYFLAVDGVAGANGALFAGVEQRPKNDDFANAQVLSGAQGQVAGDNVFASHQLSEPSHHSAPDGSVWYRWKAPTTDNAKFNTCGSEGDTVLDVYTGNNFGALTPVASNDNAADCGPQSRVTFGATQGTIYRIAVDSSIGSGGAIKLGYVEGQVPQTTITGGPASLTRDATPTFKFKSSLAGSTFQCRFDAKPFGPCSGPGATHTPGALPDGAHTFFVKAVKGGVSDLTPASRKFTVDTKPPQTTITSGPSGVTHDKTPTFKFASSEAGSKFQCVIRVSGGGGSFGACSGPGASHTPSLPLANGSYVFSVEAKDKAGNVDPSPATRSFTVSG